MLCSAAEDERDLTAEAERVIAAAFERAGVVDAPIDAEAIARVVVERRGIPFPILTAEANIDSYLANARVVENTVPVALAENTIPTDAVEGAVPPAAAEPIAIN